MFRTTILSLIFLLTLPVSADTLCLPVDPQILGTVSFELSEGFPSSGLRSPIDNCWYEGNLYDTSAYFIPYLVDANAHTGTRCLSLSATASSDGAYAVMPEMTFTGSITDYNVEFWFRKLTADTLYNDTLYIGILTSYSVGSLDIVGYAVNTSTSYRKALVPLSSFSDSTGLIIFLSKVSGHLYSSFLIDDITVTPSDGCPAPSDISISNITTSSVDISWTDTAGACRILLTTSPDVTDPASFALWDIDTLVTSSPATIPVHHSTRYRLYLQSVCDSLPGTFTYTPLLFDTHCDTITSLPWLESFSSGEDNATFDLPCWLLQHISGTENRLPLFSCDDIDGNLTSKLLFPDAYNSLNSLTLPPLLIPSLGYHFELSIHRTTSALASEGLTLLIGSAASGYDTTFIPTSISVAGSVGTESAQGWFTYSLPISDIGPNEVILLGYNDYGSPLYIDNLRIRQATSCTTPSALSLRRIASTSAVVQWTSSSADRYHLLCTSAPVDIAEYPLVDPSLILCEDSSLTADSAVVTGLAPASLCYIYLRALCTTETSDWTSPLSLRTSCAPYTITRSDAYFNGFENEVPGSAEVLCWDILSTSTDYPTPYHSPYSAHSGNMLLSFGGSFGTDCDAFVALPEFTNPVSSLRLRFYLQGMADLASDNDSIIVGVMTDVFDPASFIPVARFQSSETSYSENYEEIELFFDTYTGPEGRIALRRIPVASSDGLNTYWYGSFIDDVTIDLIPSCRRVSHFSTDSLAPDAALVSWHDTGAQSYLFILADTSISPLDTTPAALSHILLSDTLSSAHVLLTALSPVTTYYLYLRADCGSGDLSDFSRGHSFRTAGTIPYSQPFDIAGIFPDEMTEYMAANLDSVMAGSERVVFNPYNDFDVSDILSPDTVTIRYNMYGDRNFRLLSTPVFSFDSSMLTSLSFNLCKRDYYSSDPASDTSNDDDLFCLLAADPDMLSFTLLASWTNDSVNPGTYSLRDDISTAFSRWQFDLSSLHGTYRIVFALGSLVENDDYDIHIDSIAIFYDVADSFTVTALPSDPSMGTVSGSGTYIYGSTATLTATPLDGYRFIRWTTGDTLATIRYKVIADTTFTAQFAIYEPTSLSDASASSLVVFTAPLSIIVHGAEGCTLSLYDITGRLILTLPSAASVVTLPVPYPGIYLLRTSNLPPRTILVK